MSTSKLNDNLATLAQAAAYNAYLSLMPQIHHKTVNMSSGTTSAEPLKQTHPLDYNELAKKADELICMRFDGESNDKHIDKEEARKATQVAADQLYHQIAPKHNNSNLVPINSMDDTHSSSKESLSSYKTSSTSSSNNNKLTSPNDVVALNIVASQHNSDPAHPTRTEIDDSIPFERAVPGDAASDTQNLTIDSLPARIDETSKINPAYIAIPPEVGRYPSLGDLPKPQSDTFDHVVPKSGNLISNATTDAFDKVTNSSSDGTEKKQHAVDDASGTLDQLMTKENGNDSTFTESDDREGNTGNGDIRKKISVSRDVALASNGVSALGLSSNDLNRAPLKTQANPNNIGVQDVTS